jgi:hypothetical protein
MRIFKFLVLAAAVLGVAACTPQSAKQARGDLSLTAGAAAAASRTAGDEAAMMGPVASDIMIDVNDIKQIENWFDNRRPVSFD